MSDPNDPTFRGPGVGPDHDPLDLDTRREGLPGGPEHVSPELLDPPRKSALDELRDLVATEVATEPETYQVPTRPGWAIRYSTGMTGDQVAFWATQAKNSKKPGGLDQVKWAGLVLGSQAEAIMKNGEHPTETGEALNFRSPDLLELLETRTVAEAVRRFYGGKAHVGDGHMVSQAYALIRAAGYDENGVQLVEAAPDELDGLAAADPTPR